MNPEQPLSRETDWLFQRLNTLEQQMIDQHVRLRHDMEVGFTKVTLELHTGLGLINGRITKNTERIIVVETERKIEKAQAVRRGTWAGLLAASGLTMIWELVKARAGWP